MATEEDERSEPRSIVQIYSEFMTRLSLFEEQLSIGSKFLIGFQQALGFLGRPPINKTSALADRIIKSHGSKWLLSYTEAGCMNSEDSAQNVSKLHTCHRGLQDHINGAKTLVAELEHLLDDAASAVEAADAKINQNFDFSCNEEKLSTPNLSEPRVTDYAAMMAIIYSMVKQDYSMQVRIVSSINFKTSPEQLETYCQMWSLRPFVDDEVIREAWALVP
ncbi:uncharacterized protein LOC127254332 [Andrographis paniculata]|uniref:uncharacterized protein LOC127254332 n=1 Tax=Andrographis paniculata TaxID=175694 RepID=UPI0021E8AA92|nr:uncharacterized protein LOC127254332 [Andrographis paniculata]